MGKSGKTYQHTWDNLLKQLTDQLTAIWQQMPENVIRQSQQSIDLCREAINVLQDNIVQSGFANNDEEICFFKEIKPQFYGRVLYYLKVYEIEIERPLGSMDNQKAYYQRKFDQIINFYDDNKFWYQYYRAAESYLDEKLFLRKHLPDTPHIWSIYDVNVHPSYSTGYDAIFSRIISTEWLIEYLHKAILSLNSETVVKRTDDTQPAVKPLEWTESKSALIELIYAFKAIGAFNSGQATTKEISDYLQHIFSTELSNPSRMFQEILRRKGGNTNFLDRLKDGYLKLIDTIENKGNK